MNNPAQIPSLPPLQDRLKEITKSGIAPTMEHLRGEFMALFRLERSIDKILEALGNLEDPIGLDVVSGGLHTAKFAIDSTRMMLSQANPGMYRAIVNEAESPHLSSDLTRFALTGVLQRVEKAPDFADKNGVVSGLKAVLGAM